MRILGIESSCDDTAAAVVVDGRHILSNVISSQIKEHAPFGGVVPEIAARKHVESIGEVIEKALTDAGLNYNQIDAIGVTARHGLLRSIVVGAAAGKALALSLNVPLVGIHHIEGHIYSNILEHGDAIRFPHLCLTVSGGHTLLLLVHAIDHYELLGRALDDAAGEVYDKIARYLDLGFPGGPIIDKLALEGNSAALDLPRPMLHDPGFDFSFSGLKTAVIRQIEKLQRASTSIPLADVAASFQQAVVDVLIGRILRAATVYNLSTVTVCGGVAANRGLRSALAKLAESHSIQAFYPPLPLCTDNGAMIAGLAYHKIMTGAVSDLRLDAQANAPLGISGVTYK
jgi:N6-L-threonylcarbamoyladenine synthase